jgi:hypothetical protein
MSVKFTLILDDDDEAILRKLSATSKLSMTEVIRRILRHFKKKGDEI